MLQVTRNELSRFKEKSIQYSTISTNENSNSLAIMFPGVGYTVQGPLFHFATGQFLNKGIDVLHLDYPYGDSFYDHFTSEQLSKAVINDSGEIIDQVLKEREYENFYLIGKSFGTIAMGNELKKVRFKDVKAIWLTPLLKRDDVFAIMRESTVRGLCFIGDQDHHYDENRYKQIDQNPNMKSKLYPGMNHGMEYEGDIHKSIDILKDIMRDIDYF